MNFQRVKSPKCGLDSVSRMEQLADDLARFLEKESENIPPRIMEELEKHHEDLADIYADMDADVLKLESDLEEANGRIEELEEGAE